MEKIKAKVTFDSNTVKQRNIILSKEQLILEDTDNKTILSASYSDLIVSQQKNTSNQKVDFIKISSRKANFNDLNVFLESQKEVESFKTKIDEKIKNLKISTADFKHILKINTVTNEENSKQETTQLTSENRKSVDFQRYLKTSTAENKDKIIKFFKTHLSGEKQLKREALDDMLKAMYYTISSGEIAQKTSSLNNYVAKSLIDQEAVNNINTLEKKSKIKKTFEKGFHGILIIVFISLVVITLYKSALYISDEVSHITTNNNSNESNSNSNDTNKDSNSTDYTLPENDNTTNSYSHLFHAYGNILAISLYLIILLIFKKAQIFKVFNFTVFSNLFGKKPEEDFRKSINAKEQQTQQDDYFLKTTGIISFNILSVYSKLYDVSNYNRWRSGLKQCIINPDKLLNLEYYKGVNISNIQREILHSDNTILVAEFQNGLVLNLFVLESNSNDLYNKTKINVYSRLNNTYAQWYYDSILNYAHNFIRYVTFELNNEVYFKSISIEDDYKDQITN